MKKQSIVVALESALARYDKRVDAHFSVTPELEVVEDEDFWAIALPRDDGFLIKVSAGIFDQVADLLQCVKSLSDAAPAELRTNIVNLDWALEIALQWLMMHELHHFQMKHLELVGSAGLAETSAAVGLGLTKREASKPSLFLKLQAPHRTRARPCMELQADQDSTEIVLGAYHRESWELIRFFAACISMVMVLVEREEQRLSGSVGDTHPRAATRIFQLLGYVAEMWTEPARKRSMLEGHEGINPNYLPSENEALDFQDQVVARIYDDARLIAIAAKAETITSDLADRDAFLGDLETIFTSKGYEIEMFATAGAREWCELQKTNGRVYQLLRECGLDTKFADLG